MSNKIAIFGASGCIPGSEEYINATELGYQLASCGFDVVTGGYSGTMEAISLGASKIDNIKVEGVIVPSLFPNRPARGNQYLNSVSIASSLMDRLTKLVESTNVYIVLPGSVGTLGELVLVWNHINIDFRVRGASLKHLICFRDPWYAFIHSTEGILHLSEADISNIHFVDTVDEAVKLAGKLLNPDITD